MDPSASPVDGLMSPDHQLRTELAVVAAIGFMWLQLYYSVIPIWIHGDYYDYGWFVPPLAAFFFFRRWRERPQVAPSSMGGAQFLVVAALLLPLLFFVRALEGFDPSWRPPMMLHAAVLVLLSHWLIWRFFSRAFSLAMIPATIFALSAVPYPYQLEHTVIQGLTGWVVQMAGVLFQLAGRPVLVDGGIIAYAGTKVEVTDGCSGIQSLQSLIMTSLYFGEFFRLRIAQRFLLVGFAVLLALSVNVIRAIYLARIRFDQGEVAFDSAHDSVGHFAFAIGGLGLFLVTRLIMSRSEKKRAVIRRTNKKAS
ncbi:MAG: exosortase/archaeosortase family protein [Akkermansiaceae bacterium]|nr:exosortase/archaeosortase family protein [Akkermansiaceae bacterium]